jgi:hypothetical protein
MEAEKVSEVMEIQSIQTYLITSENFIVFSCSESDNWAYGIIHNVRILSNKASGQAAIEVLYVLPYMICRSVLRQSEQESEPSRKLF